jgi:hypothetical protein
MQGIRRGGDITDTHVEIEDAARIPALVVGTHIGLRPGIVELHQPHMTDAAVAMPQAPFAARSPPADPSRAAGADRPRPGAAKPSRRQQSSKPDAVPASGR